MTFTTNRLPILASRRERIHDRRPDFLVVGAMKAGTTTLWEHLQRRPDVFMTTPKEPNFFSIDSVFERGWAWYQSLFEPAGEDQVRGECSPSYTRYPRFAETSDRIARYVPDVKLIYIMRHPVDRFYSNFVYDRLFGFQDSLEQVVNEREYVLGTSDYALQIERYDRYFDRSQILFLLTDDLRESPQQTMDKIATFLEIPIRPICTQTPAESNTVRQAQVRRQSNQLLARLRRFRLFEAAKHCFPKSVRNVARVALTERLPASGVGGWWGARTKREVEPLTPELRAELLRRLSDSTSRLETILERDLSHWKR